MSFDLSFYTIALHFFVVKHFQRLPHSVILCGVFLCNAGFNYFTAM
jgi:hypothetical protein